MSRDVLRRRLARLPQPAVAVLRLAAVVGQEADVDVLVDAADTDEAGVVDGLEAGVIAGLLTNPHPGASGSSTRWCATPFTAT